jgi:hypothetical protein
MLVELSFGGFPILVKGDYTPETPDTRDEPGEDEDFEIEAITMLVGPDERGAHQYLNISDLIDDLGAFELVYSQALDAAREAWSDARDEAAIDRAEDDKVLEIRGL